MRRSWLCSLVFTVVSALAFAPQAAFAQYGAPVQPAPAATAAPAPAPAATAAPAPPPVGSDPYAASAAVAVDPMAGAPTGERKGLAFAARMPLNEWGVLELDSSLSHLPRYYGGYQMSSKLGILVGLNLINSSRAGGVITEAVEEANLGWIIAPGVTYQFMSNTAGNLTLDLFANLLYGSTSRSHATKDDGGDFEWTITTTGIDLGARMNGWIFPALGLGLDIGLTYANTTGSLDGDADVMTASADSDEFANQLIALYGALTVTGIFLQ